MSKSPTSDKYPIMGWMYPVGRKSHTIIPTDGTIPDQIRCPISELAQLVLRGSDDLSADVFE